MIHLAFELTDPNAVPHELSLGHMTLIGDRETISSKDAGEQAVMIFLSLDELLEGVRRLVLTSQKSCVFEGVLLDNCTFGFEVNKTSLGQMPVLYRGRTIGEVSFQDFLRGLWLAARVFVGQYRAALPNTHNIAEDLDRSMQAFEQVITAYQPPVKKKPKQSHKR